MPIIVNLDVMMARRKISLNELSEKVDITPANLSILKTGKAKAIRFSTLEAICKVLNCQPADILAIHDGLLTAYLDRDYPCPIASPSRVKLGDRLELVRELDTFYSDVDINGHINSVKYIDHLLDLWPLSWYESHRLRRIDVAYVAESYQGDLLRLYRQPLSDDGLAFGVSVCKVREGEEQREVCRCELHFE